jgi:hypothetical protein
MRRSAFTRRFSFTLFLSVLLWCTLTSAAHGQYSDNLKEAYVPWTPLYHQPAAIGNLGEIETVVDLRGFMPMLLPKDPGVVLRALNEGSSQWYKVPTKPAIELLYFGTMNLKQIIDGTETSDRWTRNVRFLTETEVKGESAFWTKVAYESAKQGPQLYDQLVGWSGFEGAEPLQTCYKKCPLCC